MTMAKRSQPGQGAKCFIYVMGPAGKYADDFVSAHGQTAICGPNAQEDFADTMWPVVVKVSPSVQSLRIEQ